MSSRSSLELHDKLEDQLRDLISKDFSIASGLCQIMKDCGSDKCSDWHNYTPVYSKIFDASKNLELKIFELGIFKGCSVRGWRKYFRNSKIFAGDVNQEYLVNDDEIVSYICDQDNKTSIESLWKNFDCPEFFDVIIDDGKHEFFSNLIFLNSSIHMLKKGGIFIVEDLTISTKNEFSKILTNLKSTHGLSEIFLLDIPNVHNNVDNCLLVIRK